MTSGFIAASIVTAAVSGAALVSAGPARAQLPTPTARSVGLAGSFTAVVTGHRAVAWNPAGLGIPARGGWSLALLPLQASAGLQPLTLDELRRFDDDDLDTATRNDWLQRIRAAGSLHGAAGGDITVIALHTGRIGLQLSTSAHGVANLSPDAAELILFEEDAFQDDRQLHFDGSSLLGSAATTAAMSYGFRVPVAGLDAAALGITVKYTIGHGLAAGRDAGSIVGAAGGTLDFPVVYSDTERNDSGMGWGIDVGVAARRGAWTAGATLRNVISTFAWDEAALFVWPGRAHVTDGDGSAELESVPLTAADPELRAAADALLEDTSYRPLLALGASFTPGRRLLLTGELRHRFGAGIGAEPARHAGVGAELRPLSFVPLRAGVAAITDGYQLGAGAGLEPGRIQLNAGVIVRQAAERTSTIAMLSLSFGAR